MGADMKAPYTAILTAFMSTCAAAIMWVIAEASLGGLEIGTPAMFDPRTS